CGKMRSPANSDNTGMRLSDRFCLESWLLPRITTVGGTSVPQGRPDQALATVGLHRSQTEAARAGVRAFGAVHHGVAGYAPRWAKHHSSSPGRVSEARSVST